MTINIGIDYSLGQSNVDRATGIHYGVISQHTVGQRWYDEDTTWYGDPCCPKCQGPAGDVPVDLDDEDVTAYSRYSCADYYCPNCKITFGSEDAYPDEPIGHRYEDSEYLLTDCLDSDIFVLKSPYYTYAQYCSPCVPGAGNLDTTFGPDSGAPKTYCLGHDWYEDDKAPYRVWRVADDTEVLP